MSKAILITGATGKQGGSAIDALLALPNASEFLILAITRDPKSSSAQKIKAKSPSIKIVQGDFNDVPAVFKNARAAAGQPIWGVFSVTLPFGKNAESEEVTGKALVDEALKNDVRHFVFTSVDRGGDEVSWTTPTYIPHFITKHNVELYLRDRSAGTPMSWTIFRPTGFMENFVPGMQTKVFLTMLRDTLKGNTIQFVSVKDIGWFAAQALSRPDEFKGKAIGLAGSELTFQQIDETFRKVTGHPGPTTFSLVGTLALWAMKEFAIMMKWFAEFGYGADIPQLKAMYPGLKSFETWLREDSGFETKNKH